MIRHSLWSPWLLRLDALLLGLAGAGAMLAEAAGHFGGVGPFAALRGSPHTIGGFEAHGLAVLVAVFLARGASLPERAPWHAAALATHLFLGGSNLLFWSSFVHFGLVDMGVVATALHAVFAAAQAACLRGSPDAVAVAR